MTLRRHASPDVEDGDWRMTHGACARATYCRGPGLVYSHPHLSSGHALDCGRRASSPRVSAVRPCACSLPPLSGGRHWPRMGGGASSLRWTQSRAPARRSGLVRISCGPCRRLCLGRVRDPGLSEGVARMQTTSSRHALVPVVVAAGADREEKVGVR